MDMNNIVIKVAIGLLFVGYTGYFTVKSFLLNKKYYQELEQFKNTHKHAEEYDESKKWVIITSLMAVVSFIICFFAPQAGGAPEDQIYYFQVAYGALGIMFLGLALETNVRKRIWFADDGFFFVEKYYRYRMIVHYNDKKSMGFFRNTEVLMGNTDKLDVSGKMGDQIKEREAQWKKNKKQKKRR